VGVLTPFVALSLILSFLPDYLVWTIFIGSAGYLLFKIIRQFKNKNQSSNLGADPEIFYSSEGEPIATFNVAFQSSKKKTGWIKITCFHRLAEVAEKYLHKGARIGIVGTLDQQKWETDEGVQRSSFQLLCNSLEFIKTDGRGFEEGQDGEGTPF